MNRFQLVYTISKPASALSEKEAQLQVRQQNKR